ncbi:hypothetical protein, partial [Dokdonella sp.]|uniref:hypothetical protein n=1 Tax=Dokdonella sp. TaxID=2291710 RepID=UPI002CDC6C0C
AEHRANAAKASWLETENLLCPGKNSEVFATFPAMNSRSGILFPAGNVYLRYGIHYGPGAGFGFQHIWKGHFPNTTEHDEAMELVCRSVARTLVAEAKILYDDKAPAERQHRLTVRRLMIGLVVVELREFVDSGPFYSVVTSGFPGKEKGSVIGALA